MRKLFLLLSAFSILVIVISSCGKKAENGIYINPGRFTVDTTGIDTTGGDTTSNDTSNVLFRANVKGHLFETDFVDVVGQPGAYVWTAPLMSTTETFSLLLANSTLNLGPHTFGDDSVEMTYGQLLPNQIVYTAHYGFGTLTVTDKTDTTISGTFEGSFINSADSSDIINITNGEFRNIPLK